MTHSREVIVSFACNNPTNGIFRGRAVGFGWHNRKDNWSLEFDPDDFINGSAFSVNEALMTFRLHRVSYPFKRQISWYGNWCWEGFIMKRPAAVRLLRNIVHSGKWSCTAGPTRVCDWIDRLSQEVGIEA